MSDRVEVSGLLSAACALGQWWLVAAGQRKADTAAEDFYARLEAECRTSSDHLLPCAWDWNRLKAELAAVAADVIPRLVRKGAWMSMVRGHAHRLSMDDWYVTVLICNRDEEGYLPSGSGGVPDPRTLTLLLSSFPDISADDWRPEPGGAVGIEPGAGEILWSTVLPASVQAALYDEFEGEEPLLKLRDGGAPVTECRDAPGSWARSPCSDWADDLASEFLTDRRLHGVPPAVARPGDRLHALQVLPARAPAGLDARVQRSSLKPVWVATKPRRS